MTPTPLSIFFDCDFTLTGIHGGLRPYVREVFERLNTEGHHVYIWSGVRVPWDIYNNFDLQSFIRGVYFKPIDEHHEQLPLLKIPVVPDFVVDDNVGPVEAFGGYVVPPYIYVDKPDDHLWRAYEVFTAWAAERRDSPGLPAPRTGSAWRPDPAPQG